MTEWLWWTMGQDGSTPDRDAEKVPISTARTCEFLVEVIVYESAQRFGSCPAFLPPPPIHPPPVLKLPPRISPLGQTRWTRWWCRLTEVHPCALERWVRNHLWVQLRWIETWGSDRGVISILSCRQFRGVSNSCSPARLQATFTSLLRAFALRNRSGRNPA